MSEFFKIDILNLGGGVNTGQPRDHIADSQMCSIENFRPYGAKLVRRGGVTRLTSTPHTEALTSLFAYKQSTGVWTLLMGARSGMCKLDGVSVVPLPVADGRVYDPSDYPWVHYQYKDMAYATRPSMGTLKRVSSEYIMDAGIPAPTSAPTIADGAAGDIPAANFYGVYTFLDGLTLNESNHSPASAVLAHAGAKKIDWSNIGISLTPQVNARRIYRVLPNQTGQYFFVAQINDNVSTTFTGDNVLVEDLGILCSIRNSLPPLNSKWGDLWKDRLFLTDETDVFYSEIALVECFGSESVLSVFPDDGHVIRGMRAYGDRFIVGKTNKVHFLTGTDPSSFAIQTLSDRHGCWSYYSMQVAEGKLLWFGGDNFYISDGSSVEAIGGGIEMRAFVDRIPDAYKDRVIGCVFPAENLILWSCPLDADWHNKIVLAYNYKTGAWTTYTHTFGSAYAPGFLGDFYDANLEHILYATFYDGHVYRYNHGTQDVGANFTSKILTKAYGLDRNGMRKAVKRFYLLATSVAEDITLKVYGDDGAVIKSRKVSLDRPMAWKRYGLATTGPVAKANTVQIGIEYGGERHIEIEGIAAECIAFLRAGRPT